MEELMLITLKFSEMDFQSASAKLRSDAMLPSLDGRDPITAFVIVFKLM
eukprot:CAMPEP_0201606640 /NCGR_PEP_ID=MMETSP0492-20130828/6020_1 /ASSEMBLY_ACC=CAM_ASM_000837 /TAXON_ID=420259 /ORGANISM="Thalassiosira gravida, Strain GMp14c1" /LENGTH=48 /DNA_ID= /DNA_START= /DNA_END= /DNA_ORIENTATION=